MEYLKSKWSIWFQTLDANHDSNIPQKTWTSRLRSLSKFETNYERRHIQSGEFQDHFGGKGPNTRELKSKNGGTTKSFVRVPR